MHACKRKKAPPQNTSWAYTTGEPSLHQQGEVIKTAVESYFCKCNTTKLRIVTEACECCNHICRIKVILNLTRSLQVAPRLKTWLLRAKTSQGPAEALR